MKKIILTLFGLSVCALIKAQTISYSSKKDILLKDVTEINISKTLTATQNASLLFKVNKISPKEVITVTMIDNNEGSATLTTDYTYASTGNMALSANPGNPDGSTFTVVLNKMPAKPTYATFAITMKNGGKLNKTYVINVHFNNDDEMVTTIDNSEAPKKGADTSVYAFTFLNAANFDITGIGKTSYLGHVNVFRYPDEIYKWGFNAGMMKISYAADSSSKVLLFRNITIDPLKPLTVGSQYYKQSSYLSSIVTNTAYSLYIQPSFQLLNNKTSGTRVLLHFHGELLIFNTTAVTKFSGRNQETAIYTAQDSIRRTPVYRGNPNDTSNITSHRSVLNGYFGGGMTYILKAGTGTFYFQGTIGVTDDFPNVKSYLGTTSILNKWNSFYLVRSSYSATLIDKTTIILGTDIRGLFPDYKPFYSIYIGLNLNIEALSKILGGK